MDLESSIARSQESSRKRVAIVYHFFAHYRAPVVRELLQNGRHEYFLVADRSDFSGRVNEMTIPDESHFVHAPCRQIRGDIMFQQGLLRLARSKRYDTIIFLGNALWPATWMAAATAQTFGKRVLFWTHGWTRRDQLGVRQLRNTFYRLADGLLVYGHRAKEFGIGYGFEPENLYVVYNSLDYAQQQVHRSKYSQSTTSSIRHQLFGNSHRPMLIAVGRVTDRRRLDLLFNAVASLKDDHPVNILVVGDGPARKDLERQSDNLGLSVEFYGACYDEEVLSSLIMAANATVSPGATGLGAIHSLAYGTPVIVNNDPSSSGPEWEAIVPGVSGAYFKNGDTDELARVIRDWTLTEMPDQGVRSDCIELVEKYYNAEFQRRYIDYAVDGRPADDTLDVGALREMEMDEKLDSKAEAAL